MWTNEFVIHDDNKFYHAYRVKFYNNPTISSQEMDNLLYPFQPSPTMQKKHYNPGPHDYEREIICHASQ